jgi:hypothetical protein
MRAPGKEGERERERERERESEGERERGKERERGVKRGNTNQRGSHYCKTITKAGGKGGQLQTDSLSLSLSLSGLQCIFAGMGGYDSTHVCVCVCVRVSPRWCVCVRVCVCVCRYITSLCWDLRESLMACTLRESLCRRA